MHQNASQSILFFFFFKFSGGACPQKGRAMHTPFLTRPPSSQLAPTPLCMPVNQPIDMGLHYQKRSFMTRLHDIHATTAGFSVY